MGVYYRSPMKLSRRDLTFLLPALAAAQTTARKETLPSAAFRYEDLAARKSGLKTLAPDGYGEYLAGEVKRLDFRVHLLTPAEVLARGVRDNLTAVYRNFERV